MFALNLTVLFSSLISEICRFKHLHLLNLLEKNHHDVPLKNTFYILGRTDNLFLDSMMETLEL